MPAPTEAPADVSREPASTQAVGEAPGSSPGQALRFAGALVRANVPALWKRLPALDGVRRLDLREVTSVDSAGLALLADIAERIGATRIEGAPQGLDELRSAYRLDAGLGFAGS
jgi:phospholipid transport system transporter-binding protein